LALVIGATVISGAGTALQRDHQAQAQHELRETLRPAQRAVESLSRAYVDQESGQRGFLLTGDREFLQPYEDGHRRAETLEAELTRLPVSAENARLRDAVFAAAEKWRTEVAEPETALRRAGPIDAKTLLASTREGKRLFDDLRSKIDVLSASLTALVAVQLKRFDNAQRDADRASVATAVLVLFATALGLAALYFLLTRPLRRLVTDVEAVAAGDYEKAIEPAGPREVASIATAAEQMRAAMVRNSAELVAAQERLSVATERDRLAAGLQQGTTARVSMLAVQLTGLASRHPRAGAELMALVDETDLVLRDLRVMIYTAARPSVEGEPLAPVPR
jgi:CHASE3 domain sensor protein